MMVLPPFLKWFMFLWWDVHSAASSIFTWEWLHSTVKSVHDWSAGSQLLHFLESTELQAEQVGHLSENGSSFTGYSSCITGLHWKTFLCFVAAWQLGAEIRINKSLAMRVYLKMNMEVLNSLGINSVLDYAYHTIGFWVHVKESYSIVKCQPYCKISTVSTTVLLTLTHSLVDHRRWRLATADDHSIVFLLHCSLSCDISFSWM